MDNEDYLDFEEDDLQEAAIVRAPRGVHSVLPPTLHVEPVPSEAVPVSDIREPKARNSSKLDTGNREPEKTNQQNGAHPDELTRFKARLAALTAELAVEKGARRAADVACAAAEQTRLKTEESKSAAFARFKILGEEAVRQREEWVRSKWEIEGQLSEAEKTKNAAGAEMEQAATVLQAEADRICGKIGSAGVEVATPQSASWQARGGLAGIVQAMKKRVEPAVDAVLKERDCVRERAEQAEVENAIEVSRLEAAIAELGEDRERKGRRLTELEALLLVQEIRTVEVQRQVSEAERRAEAGEAKVRGLEGEVRRVQGGGEEDRRSLTEARERVRELERVVVGAEGKMAELQSLREREEGEARREREGREEMEREREVEGQTFAEQMEGVVREGEEGRQKWGRQKAELEAEIEGLRQQVAKVEEERGEVEGVVEEGRREVESQREEVARLEGALREIRDGEMSKRAECQVAQADRMVKDASEKVEGKERERREAERLRREAQEGLLQERHGREAAERACQLARSEAADAELEAERRQRQVAALEETVAKNRLELEELRGAVKRLRLEVHSVITKCGGVEAREKVALEEVERLQAALMGAEEEALSWRKAAKEEAAAGEGVVAELEAALLQISSLHLQLDTWKQSAEALRNRISAKEEIANAAISAQTAAERSLAVADRRSADLRRRLEEMAQEGEGVAEAGVGVGGGQAGCWDARWPWRIQNQFKDWGGGRGGVGAGMGRNAISAEMGELAEPLVMHR